MSLANRNVFWIYLGVLVLMIGAGSAALYAMMRAQNPPVFYAVVTLVVLGLVLVLALVLAVQHSLFRSLANLAGPVQPPHRAPPSDSAEALLHSAIAAVPYPVALIAADGTIEFANPQAQRLFALTPGKSIHALPHKWLENLLDKTAAIRANINSQGTSSAVQIFDQTAEMFFLPRSIARFDPRGEFVGITLVLIDATQLRQVEEAKSSLLSTVSHELKTPLTSLQMCVHLLLEDAAGFSPRQVDLLNTAREDAERLTRLVQELLDKHRRAQ